jgi:ribosomal protein S18 acetylase RimI-like enzyme
MTIREATLKDLPEVKEVAISSYNDTFSWYNTPENLLHYFQSVYSLDNLEKELSEPKSKLFLAVEDDKIEGFARLREYSEVEHLLGKNTVELQRLYVLTSAHGKSIGSTLINFAIQYAKDQGYEWLWLGVWEKNYKAQKFYEKWGFEKFSEHTFWQGDDPQIDWLLKKKLDF